MSYYDNNLFNLNSNNNINSANNRYINQNTTVNINEVINEVDYNSQNKTSNNYNNNSSNYMFKSATMRNLLNSNNNNCLNVSFQKITELPKEILNNFSDENFKNYSRILDFIKEEFYKLNKDYIILNKKKNFQNSLNFLNDNGEYLEYNNIISQEKTKYFKSLKEFEEKFNEYNKIKNNIEKYFQYLIDNPLKEEISVNEILENITNEIENYSKYNTTNNFNNHHIKSSDSNKLRMESINVEGLQYLSNSKRKPNIQNNFYEVNNNENEDKVNFENSNLKQFLNTSNELDEIQKKIYENYKLNKYNNIYILYEPNKFNKNFNNNFTHSFFNNRKYQTICNFENVAKENPDVYSNRKNYFSNDFISY